MDVDDPSRVRWAEELEPQLAGEWRAKGTAATADAYGVTLDAFLLGFSCVYGNSARQLNDMPETIRYERRDLKNNFFGFNFPAAMLELVKSNGIDISEACLWALLSFRYSLSLQYVSDVIGVHDFQMVAELLAAGHSWDVAISIIENGIDKSMLEELLILR